MTRLLAVFLITVLAYWVAALSWNRTPSFECSVQGLQQAADAFSDLAERRPRRANEELMKLSNRTRISDTVPTIDALVAQWTAEAGDPNPRTCRRLRESLARLR